MKRLIASASKRSELLILMFLVVANLGWIARDTRPWPVIDCYMQANNVLEALGRDPSVHVTGVRSFLTTLSQGGRPPLYQLCTIPFVTTLGYSEDAFQAVNLVFLALLFASVYRLCRELGGRLGGLVGGVSVVCFPPIVHILRQYRAYSGAIACIGLTLWALVVLIDRREARAAWGAAAGATAALLMHPFSAWVLFVPMASTWLWLLFVRPGSARRLDRHSPVEYLRERLGEPLLLKGLLPASLVPVVAVAGWYLTLGRANYYTLKMYNSSWLSAYRGGGRIALGHTSVPADVRWLAATSPQTISWPLAALTLVFVVWLLVKGNTRARFIVLWLVAAYLGLGVLAFALSWQYGAFLLPLVAAVLGPGVASLPRGTVRSVAGTMVILSSALTFSIVTWGFPQLPKGVARILGEERGNSQLGFSPDPPVKVHLPTAGLLSVVAAHQLSSGRRGASIFAMSPGLTSEAYRYIWLRNWPGKAIRIDGHRDPTWGATFPFEPLLQSRWLIVVDPLGRRYSGRRQRNPYVRALARFFQQPPRSFSESYTEAGRAAWPGGGDLVLYRRQRQASVDEIDDVVRALDLAPRFATTASLMAARALEREGRTGEALTRLEQAAEVQEQPPLVRARLLGKAQWVRKELRRARQAKGKRAGAATPKAGMISK